MANIKWFVTPSRRNVVTQDDWKAAESWWSNMGAWRMGLCSSNHWESLVGNSPTCRHKVYGRHIPTQLLTMVNHFSYHSRRWISIYIYIYTHSTMYIYIYYTICLSMDKHIYIIQVPYLGIIYIYMYAKKMSNTIYNIPLELVKTHQIPCILFPQLIYPILMITHTYIYIHIKQIIHSSIVIYTLW